MIFCLYFINWKINNSSVISMYVGLSYYMYSISCLEKYILTSLNTKTGFLFVWKLWLMSGLYNLLWERNGFKCHCHTMAVQESKDILKTKSRCLLWIQLTSFIIPLTPLSRDYNCRLDVKFSCRKQNLTVPLKSVGEGNTGHLAPDK